MKISFITTIYNEEGSIEKFLNSLFSQTQFPDEIIIVDGASQDNTVQKVKDLKLHNKKYKIKFEILIKKGNRSVGRNEAIRKATGDVIVCSDSGNILDKNWIKNITQPFKNKNTDVVAGYYKGLSENVFQECLIPYALIMPDKVDLDNFLPATRSVAFTKRIWEKVGGFNEKLSHNEDYAFAKELQKVEAKIVFKKDAIVYWIPRNNYTEAFTMFARFAYGDAESRIWRPKVIFLFFRYIVGILLLILAIIVMSSLLLEILGILFLFYLLWAVQKNYKYVNAWQAIFILPFLQMLTDWAVLKGTILGLFHRKLKY